MLKISLIFSLLCLAAASEDLCQGTPVQPGQAPLYGIYVTKLVRPGSEFSVVVNLFKTDRPLDVRARFVSSDDELRMSVTERTREGESRRILLGRIPRDYSGSQRFQLTVEGIDLSGNVMFRNCTSNFRFHSKALSILIQTDKAIYQPGQTIKFRALCMGDDLRPLIGNVTYRVEDTSKNVLLRNTRVLTSGVAGSEFKLSRSAKEGDWMIIYTYEGSVERISVSVKAYKLPKFQVKVTTPTVIYPQLPGFTVSVKAEYTFSQPVYGSLRIRIQFKPRYGRNNFPLKVIKKDLMRFEGKANIFISMDEVRREFSWNGNNDAKLVVIANVTETLTSYTAGEMSEIDLKIKKVKVEVLSKPQVVKPGLLYKALIRVTEQDGNLLMLADRQSDNLIIRYNYNYRRGWYSLTRSIERLYDIPSNGLVWVEIEARNDNFTSISFNAFTNTTRSANYWSATRAVSPSNSYVQITPVGGAARGELRVGDNAQFIVKSTDYLKNYRVMILARGLIVQDQVQSVLTSLQTKTLSYSFLVTSAMTPSITVLVSYIRPYDVRNGPTPTSMASDDNEMVADSLTLDISLALRNEMSIMTDESRVDAGSDVQIRVNSSASGSYVGLRAVDRSVLLLRSGNDITEKRVISEINEYSSNRRRASSDYYFFFPSPSRDAIDVFSDIGMTVLTNALLFKYPDRGDGCLNNEIYAQGFQNFEAADLSALLGRSGGRIMSKSRGTPNTPRTRNLFPETWLWTSAITNTDGSVSFNTTVPDTITSWEISAFSMSQTLGLGIANKQKLTVFRNFFVTLNLPLKITRGEIIIVQAIVFNYYNTSLQTNIQLRVNEDFSGVELIQPGSNPTNAGPNRVVTIPPGDAISIKFPVRFNVTGDIPIRIMASSSLARDSVVRNVYVKPEGIPQCYSTSAFFKSYGESENDKTQIPLMQNMIVRIPEGAVEGSGRVFLSTYGNILGSTMTNLRKLLRAPTGCGEQNMLTFAPDVFVTLYLQRTGQLDEATRKRAYQHIVDGYANELRYMRNDGSFSAFGERDDAGSTWLTAFVAKCFMYAREVKEDLVDEKVINRAINFLLRQQGSDGSFEEQGRVIHRAMQGGVNSPVTMTAYVLITLLETPYSVQNDRLQRQVFRATNYLVNNRNRITNDKYGLALVSYALYLAKNRKLSNNLLEELGIENNDEWLQSPINGSVYSSSWAPPYSPASSRSIEIASYTLLNLLSQNELNRAIPLLRWVVSKQNDLGGYSSTQDTVLAIQALYEAAVVLTSSDDQDLTLTATQQSANFESRVTINRENSIVYNSQEVTPVNGDMSIRAEGTGVGVAQLSVCYNIPTTPYSQEPFSCNVDVVESSSDYAMLNLCCTMKRERTEPTGMFLYELELLNGFTIDVVDEERRNPKAKLIELDQGRVNFYYDELLPQQRLCARVKLLRIAEVASVKPATFKAFDYYEPENIVVRTYNVDAWSRSGVCDVCGYECIGCPAPVITDWNPWTPCVEFCTPESQTRDKSCYDPSLMKKIDFFRCGLAKVPVEKRTCPKTFSCPSLSTGLWVELSSSFRYNSDRTCTVNGKSNRSPWTVIPGATLSGNGQWIQCELRAASLSLRQMARRFTVSFLFKPNFFRGNSHVTVMAIGIPNHRPVVTFEKPIQSNNFRFVVSIDQKRDFVENISLSALPIGLWSHVVLTWDVSTGGRVIINGAEIGDSISVRVGHSHKLTSTPKLYLGGKQVRNYQNQEYVSGSYSALNVWSAVLRVDEIQGLTRFYDEVRNYRGQEPLLSVRHLRSFAPKGFKICFRKPNYLSRIYAQATSCRY